MACLLCTLSVGEALATDGPPIQYQDVLADPDNSVQNLTYAQQLIDSGDLRHAASALERILMTEPDQASVRLLYGSVLMRLDSMEQARVELEIASKGDLSDNERDIIRKLLGVIEEESYRTHVTGYIAGGILTDDNRGANPASGTALAFDIPLPSGEDASDEALYIMGLVSIHHKTERNPNNKVFATLSHYNSDQQDLNFLDYHTTGLKVGMLLEREDVKYRFGPTGRVLKLDEDKYFESYGMSFRADRKIRDDVDGWLWARFDNEEFFDISGNGISHLRSGVRRRIGAGVTLHGRARMQYSFEGQLDLKDATADFYGYDGVELRSRVRHALRRSGYTWADITYRNEAFEGADFMVSDMKREDDLFRYQIGVSLAVKHIFNPNSYVGSNATNVSLSFSHYDSQSNIPNYDFDSNRFRIGLTKPFSGGR